MVRYGEARPPEPNQHSKPSLLFDTQTKAEARDFANGRTCKSSYYFFLEYHNAGRFEVSTASNLDQSSTKFKKARNADYCIVSAELFPVICLLVPVPNIYGRHLGSPTIHQRSQNPIPHP